MRPFFLKSKNSWIVLIIVSVLSLFLYLRLSILKLDPINNDEFDRNKVSQNHKENIAHIIQEEIRELQTAFGNLWRPSNSANRHATDRVEVLSSWTKKLANSNLLKFSKPKKILVFDGFENYYGTEGTLKCPFLSSPELKRLQDKCIINEDKLFGTGSYLGYDAHVSVRNWKPVVFEQQISSLRHIYFIQESPFVTKYADFGINNAILASYSSDSDIVLPYGYFQKFAKTGLQKNNTTTTINYAKGKSKLAAIVVSNCNAKNNRLGYVRELQKYIPIDIYGDCGPLKCDNCLDMINQTYKFYLSFEKANCRDYITEKFWTNALRFDIVPVVMGAPREDYEALAPANSYIHIEDFASAKNLANYLQLLNTNDILYNKYFEYRQFGEVINVWQQFFCRLCSILFYADIIEPPVWQEDASWGKVNHCLPVNKWFWSH